MMFLKVFLLTNFVAIPSVMGSHQTLKQEFSIPCQVYITNKWTKEIINFQLPFMHLERLCMLLCMQIHALASHYSTSPCTWGRLIDKCSVGEHAILCYIVRYRILLMLWSSRVCRCQPERTLFLEKIDLTHSFKQNWTQKIIWSNVNYCFRVHKNCVKVTNFRRVSHKCPKVRTAQLVPRGRPNSIWFHTREMVPSIWSHVRDLFHTEISIRTRSSFTLCYIIEVGSGYCNIRIYVIITQIGLDSLSMSACYDLVTVCTL